MKISSVEDIIQDIADGKMVIIVDDTDRENEGDLVMAASKVTPDAINFMATYGRGLICLPLMADRCEQLNLPMMVTNNQDYHCTNFTTSIEAAKGVTTGISAYDRAQTVRAAIKPDAKPEDIVQPGHIFPLRAHPGGVLIRAGHTEAGCDLARLANLEPAAVIVEIMNDDGTMARRDDLDGFADKHDLKIGTIEDLIHYRIKHERTVKKVNQTTINTTYGEFDLKYYYDDINDSVHLALVKGEIDAEKDTLVRVHIADQLIDILPIESKDFGWPLADALRCIDEAGSGVAVILRFSESSKTSLKRLDQLANDKTDKKTTEDDAPEDLRTYGIGAQILTDIGVKKMKLLSAPKKLHALGGFGLEVTDYVWDQI